MNTILLACEHISKTFPQGDTEHYVLRDVSMSLMAGECSVIMGCSGSGKSTLLHILSGLDQPTSGSVHIKGKALSGQSINRAAELRRNCMGFVYQFHHLLPEFDTIENICMPLWIQGKSGRLVRASALEILDQVGLRGHSHHAIHQLSGGERQRVAIARALVSHPALLFADEPTGNLDQETSQEIADLLRSLNRRHNIAMLIVTHDIALARTIGNPTKLVNGQLHVDAETTLSEDNIGEKE